MAKRKDDNVSMPSTGAGLTKYFDGHESKIMVGPEATMFIVLATALLIVLVTSDVVTSALF